MVEMGVRELRGIKALADGLAEIAAGLPDVEAAANDAADGFAGGKASHSLVPRIHPPAHRGKGRAKGGQAAKADKAKPAPQPAQGGGKTRAARACVVCGKEFRPKTSEKTCSPRCHTERWAEQKRAWAAKHYAGIKAARGKAGSKGYDKADAKPAPPAQVRDQAKRSAGAQAIAQAGREARLEMLRSLDPGAAEKGQATA